MKSLSNFLETDIDVTEIKEEVLSHRNIQDFIKENNFSNETIDRNLTDLYRFIQEVHLCHGCTGLDKCKMDAKGYKPFLRRHYNKIAVGYKPCDFMSDVMKEHNEKPKIKFYTNLDVSYDDFDTTPERQDVIQYIIDFVQTEEYMRGAFISGKPGVGKTRILLVTAKKLAKNSSVIYVNYPDFVREFKKAITDGTVEEKVKELKKVDYLVLDDFSHEGLTSNWYRDEILLPILQHRMNKKKPVFFGSNYTLDQLEEAMHHVVKDSVKIEVLLDRIRFLAKPFELSGKNYRIQG